MFCGAAEPLRQRLQLAGSALPAPSSGPGFLPALAQGFKGFVLEPIRSALPLMFVPCASCVPALYQQTLEEVLSSWFGGGGGGGFFGTLGGNKSVSLPNKEVVICCEGCTSSLLYVQLLYTCLLLPTRACF